MAYKYCCGCGAGMDGPMDLSTYDILHGLFLNGVECKDCSAVNDYNVEALIEELSERIGDK